MNTISRQTAQPRWVLATVSAVFPLLLGACGAGREQQPAPADLVHDAVVTANEAAVPNGAFTTSARYHPIACDAPPWQLWLRGGWERVVLTGVDVPEERGGDTVISELLVRSARNPESDAAGRLWDHYVVARRGGLFGGGDRQ